MPADPAAMNTATTFRAAQDFDEFLAAQWLATALLPPHRLRALLEYAGGLPSQAAAIPETVWRGPAIGLTERQTERLRDAIAAPVSPRLEQKAVELDAAVVSYADPAYPSLLDSVPNAPPLLFVRGTLLPDDTLAVAMVGSRRATLYGRAQTDRFARAFAGQGITVVSGGAAGIDTAAHKGALEAGGRTIAVLGCGVDVTYPAENKGLFARIVERGGAVISEFPMETTPEPWRFPTRNRIIAGMTRLTLVLESPVDSGALITARDAADYGRDVWAVPGAVDSGRSKGCHRLIQDGAGLADCPEDVILALGLDIPMEGDPPPSRTRPARARSPKTPPALPSDTPVEEKIEQPARVNPVPSAERTPAPPALVSPSSRPSVPLTPDEEQILAHFDETPRHLDIVTEASGLSAARAAVAVTLLEMKSLIERLPGNLFARARG